MAAKEVNRQRRVCTTEKRSPEGNTVQSTAMFQTVYCLAIIPLLRGPLPAMESSVQCDPVGGGHAAQGGYLTCDC